MKKLSQKIKIILILFTVAVFLLPSYAEDSIKVMNWNLLHFSRTAAADRIDGGGVLGASCTSTPIKKFWDSILSRVSYTAFSLLSSALSSIDLAARIASR